MIDACEQLEMDNDDDERTSSAIDDIDHNNEYGTKAHDDQEEEEEEDDDDDAATVDVTERDELMLQTLACNQCNKQFDSLHRLQRHMIGHDVNPHARKFKCEYCDKAFKFKHHLKVS